jgi:protein associated with RNAse G/E
MGHEVVRVDFRKYDGSQHRGYPAHLLGEDEHGVWLGVPRGVFASDEFKYEEPYVLLVPRGTWWTAMFNSPPRRTEVYCDITTPATWHDGRVQLVDLDLDVRRRRTSHLVELLDEDEFAEHSQHFGYPPEVTENAWSAARWLVGALDDGTEPFATAFQTWLNQVT